MKSSLMGKINVVPQSEQANQFLGAGERIRIAFFQNKHQKKPPGGGGGGHPAIYSRRKKSQGTTH